MQHYYITIGLHTKNTKCLQTLSLSKRFENIKFLFLAKVQCSRNKHMDFYHPGVDCPFVQLVE